MLTSKRDEWIILFIFPVAMKVIYINACDGKLKDISSDDCSDR